ncbi:type IV pilus modification protein PilV [Luteibacter sp.]|uniref:type IV pilus modification protein PilV n=1 Tax=Luteibacter sp. TaxID=1886636 RepID=UPI002809F899|nr:type IV pilus modification protein PilV [Luteibacter sp.]MDQ8051256.1 type IV pilus modification protein PilV [Luteibacter sp.]
MRQTTTSRAVAPRVGPGVVQQSGVGLIEILIAVLVMAIGLLGLAALQAAALRNSQSSLERSQAVVLSYAILDSMRANVVEARAGLYDIGTCDASPGTGPSAATPANLGAADRAAWIAALKAELGANGCGQITCAAVPGTEARNCKVIVRWDDSRGTAGDREHEISTTVRL